MRGGLGDIMRKAQQMQSEMEKARAELAELTVVGSAGGGMVEVHMDGRHNTRRVVIDPEVMDDREMLEDLIAAAANDAAGKVEAAVKARMAEVTGGMGLPPGVQLPF